jgi:hypothetical protein
MARCARLNCWRRKPSVASHPEPRNLDTDSIRRTRDLTIAGLLVANVDMKASFTPIALFYIWQTPTKEWNFASAVSFPLAWLEVEANLTLGPFSVRKKESMFGLFDLVFTPLIASHHFSQTDHLAFSFTFWAPTGSFEKGRLGQPEHEHLDVHSRRCLHKNSSRG